MVNTIGPLPPAPLTVAVPSQPGVQVGLVVLVIVVTTAVGSVIVKLVVAVHRFASVTVTVYVPAHRPVIAPVLALIIPGALIAYVYAAVPPAPFAWAVPLHCALQIALVILDTVTLNTVGCVIEKVEVAVQPTASVAVTV